MSYLLPTLGRKLRQVCTAGLLLMSLQAAWAIQPVIGDFRQVLNTPTDTLTIWRTASNPDVFIFDFPSLTYQGRSFNRITQFTEQQFSEPYLKVLTNQELESYIQASKRTQADFVFGHDVLVSELVQFFNYALRDKIELHPEELDIREFLSEQGLIRFWRGFYQAMRPDVVLLSIPQTQNRKADEPKITIGARHTILLHELSHAEYYTNIHYRKFCQRFWQEILTQEQRNAFKRFLANANYSVNNEELLINETQAYLMFTPDRKSFNAQRAGFSDIELESIRDAFRRKAPPIPLPMPLPGDM